MELLGIMTKVAALGTAMVVTGTASLLLAVYRDWSDQAGLLAVTSILCGAWLLIISLGVLVFNG